MRRVVFVACCLCVASIPVDPLPDAAGEDEDLAICPDVQASSDVSATNSLVATDTQTDCDNPEGVSFDFAHVKNMKASELDELAKSPSKQNYLIDLDAWWCGVSQRFAPKFDDVASRLVMRSDLTLLHVDVSRREDIRRLIGVTGYPTVVLWKRGTSLKDSVKYTGPRRRANMLSWVEYVAPPAVSQVAQPSLAGPLASAQVLIDEQTLFCEAAETTKSTAPDYVCDSQFDGQEFMQESHSVFPRGLVLPNDNKLPHAVERGQADVTILADNTFDIVKGDSKYLALYFYSPKCRYCACLPSVWRGVNYHLVSADRRPDLLVAAVDGDANPALRAAFGVNRYPTFMLANKDKTRVLGQYHGPRTRRTVFELSTWLQDLIVADENQVVKHPFSYNPEDVVLDKTSLRAVDHDLTYPYEGPAAYPPHLDSFSSSVSPSTPPSPWPSVSPSPTPMCPKDDNLMMELLFKSNCSIEGKGMCKLYKDGTTDIALSLCPETCDSCFTATHNNHVAFAYALNVSCQALGLTDCSCDRVMGDLHLCDPNDANMDRVLQSRLVYSFCPETCDMWGQLFLNNDKSFKFETPKMTAVSLMHDSAAVSALLAAHHAHLAAMNGH